MQPSDCLLNDVFTFLAYLNFHDCAPRHTRFLKPRDVALLNQLMCCPDRKTEFASKINSLPPRNNRRALTEPKTERLRWVHFLAESAGLVAPTTNLLKPTFRMTAWFNLTDDQRLQTLFGAAFPLQFSRPQFERWRAYKLPGYKYGSAAIVLEPFFALLKQLPPQTRIQLSTLLKLLALPVYDDDAPDQQSDVLLRALLKQLDSFGVIIRHNRATFEITAQGSALLHHKPFNLHTPDSKSVSATWGTPRRALDNPILFTAQTLPFPLLYRLSQFAELESVHSAQLTRTRRYRLDAALIRRALDHGISLATLRNFLENLTAAPLPTQVSVWLDANTRNYGQITLRRATLLQVKDPARLTELVRSKQIRECFQQTLSPRAVIVKSTRLKNLLRRLAWRGEQPRIEIHDPPPLAGSHSLKEFDNPTLAHLDLAARLVHQLADFIPTEYRPPYSVLLELEQRLTERDRESITALAAEFKQTSDSKQKAPSRRSTLETTEGDLKPAAEKVELYLSQIQTALAHNQPFQITYYSPYTDETTKRVVEPLRLEYRDNTVYLIGYCRLDQAERTFRVDRILKIKDEG